MRFAGLVIVGFITAFALVTWIARGMPTSSPSLAARPNLQINTSGELKPNPELKTFDQALKSLGDKPEVPLDQKTSQSDKDSIRDRMRLDLLQAANAAELSPCDPTIKANLVAALTKYATAYKKTMGCLNFFICPGRKAAEAAFFTPLDKRVHEQVAKAADWGAIGLNDFPTSLRESVGNVVSVPNIATHFCSASPQAREEIRERSKYN